MEKGGSFRFKVKFLQTKMNIYFDSLSLLNNFKLKLFLLLGLQFVKNHSCKYLKEADLQIILSESLFPFQTFSYWGPLAM